MSPFDFVNSINQTKKNLMVDDLSEKSYNAYIVNKSLSYFSDTVLLANEMNRYSHLDNRLQYDFLKQIVRKRKRFSKWDKLNITDDLQTIKDYYGYSTSKARDVLSIISKEQMNQMRKYLNRGGIG